MKTWGRATAFDVSPRQGDRVSFAQITLGANGAAGERSEDGRWPGTGACKVSTHDSQFGASPYVAIAADSRGGNADERKTSVMLDAQGVFSLRRVQFSVQGGTFP